MRVLRCVAKGLSEELPPLDSLFAEAEAFMKCAGGGVTKTSAALDDAVDRCVTFLLHAPAFIF